MLAAGVLLSSALAGCRTPPARGRGCPSPYVCAPADEQFLDDLQHRIFNYFWAEIYPETGIAIDHTENRTGKVAATGFELAAICIGVQRGWVSRDEGYQRALRILEAFWDDPSDPGDPYVEGQFGLFWHFVDGRTGRKVPIDCVAMCDSADFIAGAVVAGEYFKGTRVEELARRIYDEAQWDRFVSRNADGSPGLLSFGWVPLHVSESYYDTDGLLAFHMTGLADNSLLIYALALGSGTHPIPEETWGQYVDSYAIGEYAGHSCVRAGALFCRQVPHAFIRFSRMRDRKIDYFLDTVNAILADREFNVRENGYPPEAWGLTDCFGKDSYGHGAPPGPVSNDGTVGCTAFAGALPHVPALSLEAMKFARERFGERLWGRYGFTSSYNLKNDYVSPLYVGIELGPMIMLIENYRSGMIWDLFMRTECMKNFVRRARMSGVVDDFELPPEAPPYAAWSAEAGELRVSDQHPQHGRRCLEVHGRGARFRIRGALTDNHLLDFHDPNYLSAWVRDGALTGCRVELDGQAVALEPSADVAGTGWTHVYFALPPAAAGSRLCMVTLEGDVTGPSPAVDNLTVEAAMDTEPPARVADFRAQTGRLGSTVDLMWTAPAAGGESRLAGYQLAIADLDGSVPLRRLRLPAYEPPGGGENQTIVLESGRRYSFSIAAVDVHGHAGISSATVTAESNGQRLDRRAYDFEGGVPAGVHWPDAGWQVAVSEGNLRVDFDKQGRWDFLSLDLDPQRVGLHRYIGARLKGDVEILGKLWCDDRKQEDMDAPVIAREGEWSVLRFDTHTANLVPKDLREVKTLFLFPQPGRAGERGTFCLDDVEYSDR